MSGESYRAIIDFKDVLIFDVCICVPQIDDLLQLILHEAHNSKYSIYPSTAKMYIYLRQLY